MTKNLVELSHRLLAKFADANGKPLTGRFVSPENLDIEKSDLQKCSAGSLQDIYGQVRALKFRYQDASCVALTLSLSEAQLANLEEESDEAIRPLAACGSLFLFLADRMNLQPDVTDGQWVEEYIAGPASTDVGVDIDVVASAMEKIVLFTIKEDSLFNTSSNQRAMNYILTFHQKFGKSSSLTPRSIKIIRSLLCEVPNKLIENNLFEAMETSFARHAFLEIYKTLEYVFVLPRANALLDQLRHKGGILSIPVMEFAHDCYRELGWKRVERDSLGKLFIDFSSSNYEVFSELCINCQPFSTIAQIPRTGDEQERAHYIERVAEVYYKLRNQVVHQIWPDEMKECKHTDWQMLSEFTLNCVLHFYDKHFVDKGQIPSSVIVESADTVELEISE